MEPAGELYATGPIWDERPDERVVDVLAQVTTGRALDLGAGEGRHAVWLALNGWDVTAVDSSAVAMGNLQALAAVRGLSLDAVIGDVTSYSPRKQAYDLVLVRYLQLRVSSLKLALKTAAAALAAQGRLLLIAHDASNLDQGYGGPQNPEVLTTPEVVAGILTGLGLDVVRAEVVRRRIMTDAGIRVALDHVVEAVNSPVA